MSVRAPDFVVGSVDPFGRQYRRATAGDGEDIEHRSLDTFLELPNGCHTRTPLNRARGDSNTRPIDDLTRDGAAVKVGGPEHLVC